MPTIIDDEFAWLGSSNAQKSLVSAARNRLAHGDSPARVQAWISDQGLNLVIVEPLVGIGIRDRVRVARMQSVEDISLGLLAAVVGLGGVVGCAVFMTYGLGATPPGALALAAAAAVVAVGVGARLVIRGLACLIVSRKKSQAGL